jgi:hypothetical protein
MQPRSCHGIILPLDQENIQSTRTKLTRSLFQNPKHNALACSLVVVIQHYGRILAAWSATSQQNPVLGSCRAIQPSKNS